MCNNECIQHRAYSKGLLTTSPCLKCANATYSPNQKLVAAVKDLDLQMSILSNLSVDLAEGDREGIELVQSLCDMMVDKLGRIYQLSAQVISHNTTDRERGETSKPSDLGVSGRESSPIEGGKQGGYGTVDLSEVVNKVLFLIPR